MVKVNSSLPLNSTRRFSIRGADVKFHKKARHWIQATLPATPIPCALTPRNDRFVPIGYFPTTYWTKETLVRNLMTRIHGIKTELFFENDVQVNPFCYLKAFYSFNSCRFTFTVDLSTTVGDDFKSFPW